METFEKSAGPRCHLQPCSGLLQNPASSLPPEPTVTPFCGAHGAVLIGLTAQARSLSNMNLVGSYAHHHHHHSHPPHPMLHEPFLFGPASRCHQERPYFQSWLLSPADAAPDFPAGGPPPTTAVAAAAYGPDARPSQSPGRLEALGSRLPKRKGSGPKKERRRTESINSAFAELRECIPNVPADTKLSKIKTLRLATSYIAYLMDVLAKDAQAGDPEAFKAELKKTDGWSRKQAEKGDEPQQQESFPSAPGPGEKRIKGRTGWPQQVWALELNQ
ncbi:Transcription factor 15 [Apodemus speciosus]|uniref:Heart- and neural crest derivatives-expressed protein 1 n=1 Tax=Apodemus speciosus TaxID=105296 RepID=A0ABQ0FAF3_APOSI